MIRLSLVNRFERVVKYRPALLAVNSNLYLQCHNVIENMTLQTAVVGAGVVADRHLFAVQECPLTELVGICDLDEDRARNAAREYAITPYFDIDDLLDEEELDWIHICTPVQTHVPLAVRAIEAGVPVQIEKPVTETIEEFRELESTAERHDVPISVIQNHLFSPGMRDVTRRINSGELGAIQGIDVVYPGTTEPSRENRGSWAFELPGGEFEEGIPHPIYVALQVGGYPESTDDIQATTSLFGEYEQDFKYDGAQLQYLSEDNTLCSIKLLSGGPVPQYLIHIHGERASLTLDLVSQTVVPLGRKYVSSPVNRALNNVDRTLARTKGTFDAFKLFVQSTFRDDWETTKRVKSHCYQIDMEARALLGGSPMPVPLEHAEWTTQLIEAIRDHSEERFRSVSVDASSGAQNV
jgi:predicted dehydrogenase